MIAANKRAKDFLKTFFSMYYLPNGVLVNTLPELKKLFLFKYGDRAHYPPIRERLYIAFDTSSERYLS